MSTPALIRLKMDLLEDKVSRNETLLADIERAIAEFKQLGFFKKVVSIVTLVDTIVEKIKQARRENIAHTLAFNNPTFVKNDNTSTPSV